MDINFNVAFAEDGQKSEINENTWKLGWVEIVGGINGVPTAQQFNQFGYIFDKKANIAYAKATEASKGLDDKADKTSVEAALAEKANSADVVEALKGKSDTGHTHDDRYYTESETDALLNVKANKSDIPTSLPADGGNADTVDGKHASDFMQNLGYLTTGSLLDHVLTMTESGYLFVSGGVTDTPVFGQFFFVDVRRYAGGHYAITATRFNAGGVYTNRYNNNSDTKKWYGWANVADGGNAVTANTAGTLATTASNICLRNLSSGTDAATWDSTNSTGNCPPGAWYGQHS